MNTDLNLGPSHHGTPSGAGTTRRTLGEEGIHLDISESVLPRRSTRRTLGEEGIHLDISESPIPRRSTRRTLGEEGINLDIHESLHSRPSPRLRHSQQYRESWRQVHGHTHPLSSHLSDTAAVHYSQSGPVLSTAREDLGEGSNAAAPTPEIRNREVVKICDNKKKNSTKRDENTKKCKRVEEDTIKGSDSSGGGFFDCNICLDLAKEPVLTGCGHLFCWPCLYKWLYIHSCARECPICKGTVSTDTNVTPIYGRGGDISTRESDEDNSGIKIPERPPAKGRIENKRPSVVIPTTESFIQRDGGNVIDWEAARRPRYGWSDFDRRVSLVSMFHHAREQNRLDRSDLSTQSALLSLPATNISETERRVISHIHRTDAYFENVSNASVMPQLIPNLADQTTTTTTRVDDEIFLQPQEDSEPLPPIDDRDSSFSSVAAAIHREIDPSMSLSTSSSRRRRNDMDSGDSRNSRRRRLN